MPLGEALKQDVQWKLYLFTVYCAVNQNHAAQIDRNFLTVTYMDYIASCTYYCNALILLSVSF